MSRFRFELSQPGDEVALRGLLADTPMPGNIALSFEREPNYFFANQVLGPHHQTIICRDESNGDIVGVGTRSTRFLYVDRQPKRVGYLSGLRFASHVRGIGLLSRGFRFLRQLHDDDPDAPDFYLTTIASDNEIAKRVLTRSRGDLPVYHRIGTLQTLVIPRRRRRRQRQRESKTTQKEVTLETLSQQTSIGPWLEFLNDVGKTRLFFPQYEESDFCDATGTFRDLDRNDVLLLKRRGEIIATAGIWNQQSFRQTVVKDYSGWLRFARPMTNAWSACFGGVRLPPAGATVSASYACCLLVDRCNSEHSALLIRELAERCGSENLLVGCASSDEALTMYRRESRFSYRTDLYAVDWNADQNAFQPFRDSAFYLELGCL